MVQRCGVQAGCPGLHAEWLIRSRWGLHRQVGRKPLQDARLRQQRNYDLRRQHLRQAEPRGALLLLRGRRRRRQLRQALQRPVLSKALQRL